MSERIVVVGGGLAGLSATIKAAEAGATVDLLSLVPVKRSHSVCAQGGINAATNANREGDHPLVHASDTLHGGEYLADQPLVVDMCFEAPRILALLDRMGVPFNRTAEGDVTFRRFGGTLYHRTAYAGSTTGQQLMYALDEQVRRLEAKGLVEKHEYTDFLSLVIDGAGRVCGVTALDLWTSEIRAFTGGAVILATGGPGMVFGRSTNSLINTGAAAARAFTQGARYTNGEFVQVHPTAIPGEDKFRLLSESVRAEGGRLWVPRNPGDPRPPAMIPEADRDYFLEERYPQFGNLVARDVATREIFNLCVNERRGIGHGRRVYLDITPARCGSDPQTLERKLGGVFEIYRKFVGDDPLTTPMQVFPAVHYSMGGLWVAPEDDGDQLAHMTNLPGLFAAGEVDCQYHGANRLGANALLSCIYGGFLAGRKAMEYAAGSAAPDADAAAGRELARRREETEAMKRMDGPEDPFFLLEELGDVMTEKCTVVRTNAGLDEADGKLRELDERWHRIGLRDHKPTANRDLELTRALKDMFRLARAIVRSARQRDECRGAHYKPEFELPPSPVAGAQCDPASYGPYQEYIQDLQQRRPVPFRPRAIAENGAFPPETRAWLDAWIDRERKWARPTHADYQPEKDDITISYGDVATSFEPPRPRLYG